MPLVQTRGAASAQGFGEFAQPAAPANYIEDVFSTYLYTGDGSTQTITNGIDLAGEGGLVWLKSRSQAYWNNLIDTARGPGFNLWSNDTANSTSISNGLTAFNANGFTLGSYANTNQTGETFASWTFRKQAKFFDIVTWTGTGSGMTINHNLGSVPGMIIMKKLGGPSGTGNWVVWHRGLPIDGSFQQYQSFVVLNLTNANSSSTYLTAAPTSTSFSIDNSFAQSSVTYVAYLFAHNAGGFGAAGTDNVISCGSFTTDGSGSATVNLGYEPQYLMIKNTTSAQNWFTFDVMREWSLTSQQVLRPNLSDAEFTAGWGNPTATGFYFNTAGLTPSSTYIYVAIRRPMKPPTSGTQVFNTNLETSTSNPQTLTTGFPVDLSINTVRDGNNRYVHDRLRGGSTNTVISLFTNLNSAESVGSGAGIGFDNNTAIVDNNFWLSTSAVFWNFRRATGFFDIVCYTGTFANRTVAHNLGVVPELMIVKIRSGTTGSWFVYTATTGNTNRLLLNDTVASGTSGVWNNTSPTATEFTVGAANAVNGSGYTYVAYLFATLSGVSKVGSYAGTGATQTINCGFTGGARFVLIKRSNDSGGWYVWDTARGMVAGTDPFLALNTASAETNLNTVYTATTGFQIVGTDPELNASGSTYIFLAIA